MCGIAGLVSPDVRDERAAAAAARAMAETLVHRGPDGGAVWANEGVGLAHRRLSIIDIEGGTQPMVGPSGAVIVFNGEIYNYLELRDRLAATGRRFVTHSDTEVLLALFEERGPACLDQLVGMFALAIWDPKSRRLFLARDRLGKKPLFVARSGPSLAFASEIKALMALESVRGRARLDPQALSDFLSFGYVLGPKTFYANVVSLPAGHAAWFDADSGAWQEWDYWKPQQFFTGARQPFTAATSRRFTELLDDAVRIRLRSDVPLGAFLSGGLDSSAVVESMARQMVGKPQAFTVGFAEDSYDESVHARQVAEHLGVDFFRLDQPPEDTLALDRLIHHIDQPFADTSILPTFELCRATRQRVTVALSGDGADELLAGYATYKADRAFRWFQMMPKTLQRALHGAAHRGLRPSGRKVGWEFKVKQFLAAHGLDRERAHGTWRLYFSESEKRRLLTPQVLEALGDYDPFDQVLHYFNQVPGASFLDRSLYVDLKTWLQDDILVKVDRMSMANSLEVRSPFLDHRLVEFAAQLEPRAKMDGAVQKAILRAHLRGRLPKEVLHRPKQGFGAPTRRVGLSCVPPGSCGTLLRPDFEMDPAREDTTYKGFALAALTRWFDSPGGATRL